LGLACTVASPTEAIEREKMAAGLTKAGREAEARSLEEVERRAAIVGDFNWKEEEEELRDKRDVFLQRGLQKSRASQSINQWISRSTALETADKRYQRDKKPAKVRPS
jgi:hypothetical protein